MKYSTPIHIPRNSHLHHHQQQKHLNPHHFNNPSKKKMKPKTHRFIFITSIIISWLLPLILGQQPYIRQLIEDCGLRDNSTSVLGYNCNGLRPTCQAYLTFRSQPPYNSVATISALLSANSSQLAQLNSVSENSVFETNRVVLIPVQCSCSGDNYQANTSYTVRQDDSYFIIANNTFQGLTSCQALQVQNNVSSQTLVVGERLTVPLRCACPTQQQVDDGVNFLLSYLVTWNQFVYSISTLFGVDTGKTLAANGLSETDSNIYPFTTLLVPLENPPTSSQVTATAAPPPPSGTVLPATPPSGGGSGKTWVYVVVGVVGGVVGLVFVVGVVVFLRRKKAEAVMSSSSQKERFQSVEKPLKKEGEYDESEFLESISSIAQSIKIYPFQQLKSATDDFSPSCWIRGSVYRGTINADLAAIKKMSGDVSNEISLLNKINHFNLVRLSGVSFNEGNWYLVYEYASNGALDRWIHDDQNILGWEKRVQIAADMAAGLNYLHSYTSTPHIHKDLNSSNVLLDSDLRAKIANFGLARSTEGQEGEFALTRHIVGTKGYMAPEYLENGVVSVKLDVYSFGVLLLEILTGKEVSMLYEEVNTQLSELLTPVLSEGGQDKITNLIDPLLLGNYNAEHALVLFRIVDSCLKKDPAARPSMDDIFQSLSRMSISMFSGEWAVKIS